MQFKDFDPTVQGITQGLIGTFGDCREKARLWLEGWEASGSKLAMRFGSAGHDCLEALYTHYIKNTAPRKAALLYEEVAELSITIMSEWGKAQRAGSTDPDAIQDTEYIEGVIPVMMPEYFKHYKSDLTTFKWLGLETEFAQPFNGVILRGKRDGVYKVKGSLWVFETKFKSQISERLLNDTLAFDLQNLFYLLATKLETSKKVAGVMYNVIRRPGLRQGKSESFEAFCQRVPEDIAKRPEWYFIRFPLSYPKVVLDQFTKELRWKLGELHKWLAGDMPTYKNERGCHTFYGQCEYLKACAQGNTAGYIQREKLYPELGYLNEEDY